MVQSYLPGFDNVPSNATSNSCGSHRVLNLVIDHFSDLGRATGPLHIWHSGSSRHYTVFQKREDAKLMMVAL